MKTVSTIQEVRTWRHAVSGDVGLVPTMGFLHEGHLSLVARARAENASVAASLFVNPTQFGANEDFARYPRDLARDQALLAEAGCDLLLAPPVEEIYPHPVQVFVEPGAIAEPLEGTRRPGHFRGVATVVLKLFGIFEPTRAYFGEKDAQQLAVIRHVVRGLDVPVEVVGCPTRREADGLAMSSRNVYLSPAERTAAPALHRALMAAQHAWDAGERCGQALRQVLEQVLRTEPLARIDYVSAADPETLQEIDSARGPVLVSMAVYFGRTRLIDNRRLEA
jgi:pantoate--beta-alanine ligase